MEKKIPSLKKLQARLAVLYKMEINSHVNSQIQEIENLIRKYYGAD